MVEGYLVGSCCGKGFEVAFLSSAVTIDCNEPLRLNVGGRGMCS